MKTPGFGSREAREIFVGETLSRLDAIRPLRLTGGEGRIDASRVNLAFRQMHSLKSAANLLGYGNVEELCHAVEDVLQGLRDGYLPPGPEVEPHLEEALDTIEGMVRRIGIIRAIDVTPQVRKLCRLLPPGRP